MPQPAPQNRKSRIALLGLIAVLALCGFQYGDKLGLNGLPFAQVRPLVGDLSKAERMAKQGNIDFFAGQPVAGTPLTLANLPTRIASSRRKRMHTTTRFARNCAPRRVAPYFIPRPRRNCLRCPYATKRCARARKIAGSDRCSWSRREGHSTGVRRNQSFGDS